MGPPYRSIYIGSYLIYRALFELRRYLPRGNVSLNWRIKYLMAKLNE